MCRFQKDAASGKSYSSYSRIALGTQCTSPIVFRIGLSFLVKVICFFALLLVFSLDSPLATLNLYLNKNYISNPITYDLIRVKVSKLENDI